MVSLWWEGGGVGKKRDHQNELHLYKIRVLEERREIKREYLE